MQHDRPELPLSLNIIIRRGVQELVAGHVGSRFSGCRSIGAMVIPRCKLIYVCALCLHKQETPSMYE